MTLSLAETEYKPINTIKLVLGRRTEEEDHGGFSGQCLACLQCGCKRALPHLSHAQTAGAGASSQLAQPYSKPCSPAVQLAPAWKTATACWPRLHCARLLYCLGSQLLPSEKHLFLSSYEGQPAARLQLACNRLPACHCKALFGKTT